MTRIVLSFAALFFAICPPLAPQDAPGLIGRRIHVAYETGPAYEIHYQSADSASWKAVAGPTTGNSGTERIYWSEISPGVFFINWLESKGTTVSQVLDLNRNEMRTFSTWQAPQGRQQVFHRGRVTVR